MCKAVYSRRYVPYSYSYTHLSDLCYTAILKHSLPDSRPSSSHKAHGACRALASARPTRTMELVSLARHNLENTWLLCKTNQQAMARLRRSLDTRMNCGT